MTGRQWSLLSVLNQYRNDRASTFDVSSGVEENSLVRKARQQQQVSAAVTCTCVHAFLVKRSRINSDRSCMLFLSAEDVSAFFQSSPRSMMTAPRRTMIVDNANNATRDPTPTSVHNLLSAVTNGGVEKLNSFLMQHNVL